MFNISQNIDHKLTLKRAPIVLNNKVRRLRCNVDTDIHTSVCDKCFDFDFDGKIFTDIPCLEKHHIYIDQNDNDNHNDDEKKEEDFMIGVIFGPSGSGKTSTTERLFGKIKEIEWNDGMNIAQHFESKMDIKEKFNAVSLPLSLALSYYNQLSDGEKHRVDIARQLGQNNAIIDEFTSYLDRETAKKVARGVSNYIYRKNNKNIIFSACHNDIVHDLNPNFCFDIENKRVVHFIPKQIKEIDDGKDNKIDIKHKFIHNENIFKQAKIRIYLKPAHYMILNQSLANIII